jgi:hypothetical protein
MHPRRYEISMNKKYKIAVLLGILGIFLIAAINILSAQADSQSPAAKSADNSGLLSQADIKADNVTSGNSPIIQFPEEEFDFGNVQQESEVSHVFKVRNTGKAPLKIINAKAS